MVIIITPPTSGSEKKKYTDVYQQLELCAFCTMNKEVLLHEHVNMEGV